MNYGESLRQVLIRKINKAERDLSQLKMDYCRFVFGISHRSKVSLNGSVYQVKAVDLDSMVRTDSGEWTKPKISVVELIPEKGLNNTDIVQIGTDWELVA